MGDLTPYSGGFVRPEAEVRRDLESFAALLRKWNAVQNLVSRETENALWSRHIVDSLQLLPLAGAGVTAMLGGKTVWTKESTRESKAQELYSTWLETDGE